MYRIFKVVLIFIIFVLIFGFVIWKLFGNCQFGNCKLKQTVEKIEVATSTIIPKPTEILESGIPDYFLNKTAFVPQAPEKKWDQPWQDTCEEAAILTVHYFLENKTPELSNILDDYKILIAKSNTHDINLAQMSQIASDLYNYDSKIIDNPDTDTIEKYLSQGNILIAPANGQTLYQENKYFKNGGPLYHNIVILGYDHAKQKFIVHDVGTQFGAYFKYSYQVLMDSLHDLPKSGDKKEINQGSPRLLLLLK